LRKTERLDQILIRLGHVTQAEVEEAVARQKEHGGRIGTNLVEIDALTEEQLFDGLVEQFRVPTIVVDESSVLLDLLERMPEGVLEDSLIVPVAWNEALGVLSLAVANPSDEEAIERVRAAFGARKVRVSLAPESVLAHLVTRLGEVGEGAGDSVRLVALPELFEPESRPEAGDTTSGEDAERRVVMVTGGGVRKNFLPSVFRQEGCDLVVVTTVDEAREALSSPRADAVLVSAEMEASFAEWVRTGSVPPPHAEVTVFSSVSDALLENPVPYTSVTRSLRAVVQALAEYRCSLEGVSPPYSLMANDLDALVKRLRLGRRVGDGLNIGLHLLMPVQEGTSIDPFRTFAASVELARRIRFPWAVDAMLGSCLGLYLGRIDLEEVDDPKEEVLLAAQLLAIVWFRHNLVRSDAESAEDSMTELRTSLRELAGRFTTLDVIEVYIEVIADRGGADADVGERQVLLLGAERISRALAPALTRIGCVVTKASDTAGAQASLEELGSVAIVVDHEALGGEVEKVCRVLRLDGAALLFVLTDHSDPALVLNLLDIGIDDVFGPPHDFDIVAARIHRAIRSRPTTSSEEEARDGQFAATFEAFSFLDLAQMLANGRKSVRVHLTRGSGEEGIIFLERGRPIHASCGALAGPEAVYEVIAWEDDGGFTVREETDFPEPNIEESIESLLMEGVRLLDESHA
jgi:Domain of unknown function (DUF4388)/MshEN domain